jgi:hypothetical protein
MTPSQRSTQESASIYPPGWFILKKIASDPVPPIVPSIQARMSVVVCTHMPSTCKNISVLNRYVFQR